MRDHSLSEGKRQKAKGKRSQLRFLPFSFYLFPSRRAVIAFFASASSDHRAVIRFPKAKGKRQKAKGLN